MIQAPPRIRLTQYAHGGGCACKIPPGELEELSPIEITLPAEGRKQGDVVPVRLRASITAIGTLLLEAVPLQPLVPDERWKIELSVRQTS